MANPRIACVNDQIFPLDETDSEQIACMLAALGRRGADVELWLPSPWGRPSPSTVTAIADYYSVEPTFKVVTRRKVFPIPRWFEKLTHPLSCLLDQRLRSADVLYTRNLPMVHLALRLTKMPVLYETYRPWPRQMKMSVPSFRWMVKHPRLLGIVTHSALAAEAYTTLGLPDERCLIAHNGYDPARMLPMLDKAAARAKLALPASGRIVCYTGHVNLGKGLGLVLDMAARMPDVTFLLVGSQGHGPVEQRAEQMANVRVFPWMNAKQAVQYLYAADVLLVPPTSGPLEKIGNTVLPIKTFQYMATGRAIFGPATPDLAEVLRNGENAVLVTPDDVGAAVAALTDLLRDDDRLHRVAATARSDSAGYTWDSRAERLLAFIRDRLPPPLA